MDDELGNENMNFMEDDAGREIVSKSKKITLNMLWDELQKANKSIEELKLRIEEIKNDISHILGHLEKNQWIKYNSDRFLSLRTIQFNYEHSKICC